MADKIADEMAKAYKNSRWYFSGGEKMETREYQLRKMFALVFKLGKADKAMMEMPKHIQLQQLPLWINYLVSHSLPLPDWRVLVKEGKLSDEQRRCFMALAFMEGDREALGKLKDDGKENSLLYEAYLNMLEGDWKTADARFTKFVNSTDLLKSFEGFLRDMVLSFSLFSACLSKAPHSRIVKWTDCLQYGLFDHSRYYFFQLEEAIANGKYGGYGNNKELDNSSGYLLTLYALVNSYFLKPTVKQTEYPQLVKMVGKLFDARQNVLGVYLGSALVNLLPDDDTSQELAARMDKFQIARPVENNRKAAWEVLLDELAGVEVAQEAQADAKPKQAPEGRIVWKLESATENFGGDKKWNVLYDIMMIYQKALKRGGFSEGRMVYGDSLLSGKYDSCLSEKELKVKSCISASYYSSLNSNALDYLVDSDNVCLNKLDNPVKLVKDENALQSTVRADGTVVLTTKYPLKSSYRGDETILDFSETGICRYYRVGEKASPLQRIFDKFGENGKLVIPQKGRARLQETIAHLARVLPVTGALMQEAYKELPMVEGQLEMHVLITREQDCFQLEFRCRPISELDLFVQPGKGPEKRVVTIGETQKLLERKLSKEADAFKKQVEMCPSLPNEVKKQHDCELDDFEQILRVLSEMREAGFVLDWREGAPITVSKKVTPTAMKLSASSGMDWFGISGELKVSEKKVISLQELLEAMEARVGNFIRLGDGEYLQLTRELLRKAEALKAAIIPDKKSLKLSTAALPMLSSVFDGGLPKEIQAQLDRIKSAFEKEIPLPNTFQGTLRPYQEDGFRYLARLADCQIGCCLADDMGLGKTIQLLALLLREARNGAALVVCPASLCRNWEREAQRFAPTLHTVVLPVNNRQEVLKKAGKGDLIITSYGVLQSEEELFETVEWNVIILDEAQAIKNHLAKRTKSSKQLHGKIRIASTGTPVENNLLELWSIFDFLNPGLLGKANDFESRFCENGLPKSSLKRLVSPLIMRRKKSEVLDDLPPKTEILLPVALSSEEQALYEALRRKALEKLSGKDETSRIAILAELTRLRRFCCHPSLAASVAMEPLQGAKVMRLLELARDLHEAGNRALIFSQYVDFLHIVRGVFDKEGISYQYLDGSTLPAARMTAVDEFQAGNGDFFLISLKAGGTGLNLTAANYVILTDPWWNPAVEEQAADRVHRIGQSQPVTLYRMITSDTVEERVLELHARKKKSSDEILSESESSGVTVQELMSLFGNR
ncbi:MAG: DEAD/DEAH box helicase [Victivallales bacterium]|nr:DEAD/DEAH box helicase [Victivallales bacterium]